jgi:serine/threonine protein phosphatase PrpC
MQFSIYQESRRGARKSNQDRIASCYSRESLLMLVADGMGGHLRGEMAAQIAVQCLTEAFQREARPGLHDPRAFLRGALIEAHHAIGRKADAEGLPESPRTTCVACVVQSDKAYWAHAGDSRLYHIRDGTIVARTKDHSLVQQLIDSGRMREEALGAHPERNRIFNCLGSRRPPRVDLSDETQLHPGDTLMLCSDGLWGPLSGKIVGSTLLNMGIMQGVPKLLDDAERRAGRTCDNLSVVALTWEGQSRAPDAGEAKRAGTPAPAATSQHRGAAAGTGQEYLSDEEIERAIDKIRSAMKGQGNEQT